MATLPLGTAIEPGGTSRSAPQEPNLSSFSESYQNRHAHSERVIPDDEHVSMKALPGFAHKEVHVRMSHADTDNRYWNAMISTSHGDETTFGFENEWDR
jgi:hypothetical protein